MGLYFSLTKDIEGTSNLGYGGFFWLRKELLQKSGMDIEYLKHCELSELNDLEHALLYFMDSEDVEGFIPNKDCHILYDEFKKYDIEENNAKRYKILMNVFKAAINDDMDLQWS
ncbi:hypothetical protein [Apilactobacillus kunkeei]|uniref:hypothetical protein n=1 Tax=Apilactobacillus kunkeei TaxID=148814 RepID=UPI0030E999FF